MRIHGETEYEHKIDNSFLGKILGTFARKKPRRKVLGELRQLDKTAQDFDNKYYCKDNMTTKTENSIFNKDGRIQRTLCTSSSVLGIK